MPVALVVLDASVSVDCREGRSPSVTLARFGHVRKLDDASYKSPFKIVDLTNEDSLAPIMR